MVLGLTMTDLRLDSVLCVGRLPVVGVMFLFRINGVVANYDRFTVEFVLVRRQIASCRSDVFILNQRGCG